MLLDIYTYDPNHLKSYNYILILTAVVKLRHKRIKLRSKIVK